MCAVRTDFQPEVHAVASREASAPGAVCAAPLQDVRPGVQADGPPEGAHEEDTQPVRSESPPARSGRSGGSAGRPGRYAGPYFSQLGLI